MSFVINTDFSSIAPDEGGSSYFPVSDSKGWLCQITESEQKETANRDGAMAVFTLTGLEGPVNGRTHTYRINIANSKSQKAVEIGMGQISAIAHVIGHLRVGNSAELHNKPFRVVVVADGDEQYPNRTKVQSVRDANGNSPKDAGKGVMGAQGGAAGFGGGNPGQAPQGSAAGAGGFGNGQPAGGFQGGGNNSAPNGGAGFAGAQNGGGFANGGAQNGSFDPNAGQQGGNFSGTGFSPNNGGQQGGGFGNGQPNNGGNTPAFGGAAPNGGAPNWNR